MQFDFLTIFLGIVTILIALIVLIVNIYILVYFSHPEESFTKGIWFYRILVVASLSFGCYLIFAIPIDIASAKRDDSIALGYPMDYIWVGINLFVCFMVIVLLPIALILYNDDTEGKKYKIRYMLKWFSIFGLGHTFFILLYYLLIKESQLPAQLISKSVSVMMLSSSKSSINSETDWGVPEVEQSYVAIKLWISHCVTAHITLIGSFLFVLLAGYGLAYTPMQFLNSFLNRPQIRDAEDYTLTKMILRQENEKLINETKRVKDLKLDMERTIGFIAQRRKRFALKREVNLVKAKFLEFEEVMKSFEDEKNIHEVNPLIHLSYLVIGVVGFIGSFLIIFHT